MVTIIQIKLHFLILKALFNSVKIIALHLDLLRNVNNYFLTVIVIFKVLHLQIYYALHWVPLIYSSFLHLYKAKPVLTKHFKQVT